MKLQPILVILFLGMLVSIAGFMTFSLVKRPSAALPVIGEVHDFSLVNQDNEARTKDDFRGQTWVAAFMFTTCSDICPMMAKHIAGLQKSFHKAEHVKFVTITVNPENDSPEVLKAYAERFGAETKQWIFLTGSRETITNLAVRSFKLGDINEPVFHSAKLTLVDGQGRIRGYYDGTSQRGVAKLLHDLDQLSRSRP
jgi:protein SCO1/2